MWQDTRVHKVSLNRRFILVCFFITTLVVLTGCPSYMTYHSTRPIEPGKLELVGGAAQVLLGSPELSIVDIEATGIARVGVTKKLDVGLRLRSDFVIGGELKYRFLQGDRLHIAVAPGAYFSVLAPLYNALAGLVETEIGVEDLGSAIAYEVHLPLLFGIPIHDNILIIGPKLSFANWKFQAPDGADVSLAMTLLEPGVVLAFDWIVSQNLRVQPELNIHVDLKGYFVVHAGIGAFF